MAAIKTGTAKTASRYGAPGNTRMPPGGLPRQRPNANMRTAVASVPDPYGDGKERIYATVNRRVDMIEMERSHGRISEAAYMTGRTIQAVLERAGGVTRSNWSGGDRVDAASAQDKHIGHALKAAERIRAMADSLARHLGMIDMRLLRRVLGERMSFEDCAAMEGKGG